MNGMYPSDAIHFSRRQFPIIECGVFQHMIRPAGFGDGRMALLQQPFETDLGGRLTVMAAKVSPKGTVSLTRSTK